MCLYFDFAEYIIVKKIQEIGAVCLVRSHIMSDHCEDTAWNGKFLDTLSIIYFTNVTNILFFNKDQFNCMLNTQEYS